MKTLLSKEISLLLFSRKYIIIFVLVQILIFLSLATGYERYQSSRKLAIQSNQMAEDQLADTDSPGSIAWSSVTHRQPVLLSIFDSGIDNAIGRAGRYGNSMAYVQDPLYTEFPLLYMFRNLDLTRIYVILGSLVTLMLTFSSITGEKEGGTLKLMLAGSVNRTNIIIAKILGSYIALLLIFIPATLIGLLALILLTAVEFSGAIWLQIVLMIGAYLLFLFIVTAAGVAVSAFCKRNFTSLLFSLGLWILFVILIPQATVGLADQISPVMDRLELRKRVMALYMGDDRAEIARRVKEYLQTHNIPADQFDRRKEWEIQNNIRMDLWRETSRQRAAIYQDFRNTAVENYQTLQRISLLSPTAITLHFNHAISLTDYQLMLDFEDSLRFTGEQIEDFIEAIREEYGGDTQMYRRQNPVSLERKDGMVIVSRNPDYKPFTLDMSSFPSFQMQHTQVWEKLDDLFFYLLSLIGYAAVSFSVAYIAFLRYDVR